MANPNPSPQTRFKPGNPGGGKTSEQKRLDYEAAEMAARIRHRMLTVIAEKVEADDIGENDVLAMLNSDTLRLIKDSEDRAHGTPRQLIGSDPENPLPASIPVAFVAAKPVD